MSFSTRCSYFSLHSHNSWLCCSLHVLQLSLCAVLIDLFYTLRPGNSRCTSVSSHFDKKYFIGGAAGLSSALSIHTAIRHDWPYENFLKPDFSGASQCRSKRAATKQHASMIYARTSASYSQLDDNCGTSWDFRCAVEWHVLVRSFEVGDKEWRGTDQRVLKELELGNLLA